VNYETKYPNNGRAPRGASGAGCAAGRGGEGGGGRGALHVKSVLQI